MLRKVLISSQTSTPEGAEAFERFTSKWSKQSVSFASITLGKSQAEALEALKAYEGDQSVVALLAFGFTLHAIRPINSEVLKPIISSLRMVTGGGAGFDHVDADNLSKSGVYYANTPKAVARPTANLASILILATIRQVIGGDNIVRTTKWYPGSGGLPRSISPEGAILGIVGYGNIGKIVASQCRAFGMIVKYHNRNRLPKDQEDGVEFVDTLDALLAQSDVVSLHLPLSASTRHFIGPKEFAKFKKGARLVNTARGAVVDEEALVEALQSGQLSGAGLDVFENEPEVHPWLKTSYKVILTPHFGGAEEHTLANVEKELIENVDTFLETGKPQNAVNSPQDK